MTNPWHKRWQYQGRRCARGWNCAVSLSEQCLIHLQYGDTHRCRFSSMTQCDCSIYIRFCGGDSLFVEMLGNLFLIQFLEVSLLRFLSDFPPSGWGWGVNVWIARSLCSYWFRRRDIHDSLWRKHCIQCLDRDIASEVGISMTRTATCRRSRDEVTCVDLGNYLKINLWPWSQAIRLLKVFFFSRTGKSIAGTPCHYETECARDVFPYQVRKMSFRSQSIYLVINFQWLCFESTTFLDRTIPYGLCPGPVHHPPSATTNTVSCLAAVLICHEPGPTLSLQLIWALFLSYHI